MSLAFFLSSSPYAMFVGTNEMTKPSGTTDNHITVRVVPIIKGKRTPELWYHWELADRATDIQLRYGFTTDQMYRGPGAGDHTGRVFRIKKATSRATNSISISTLR